jgi:hypothetical protein
LKMTISRREFVEKSAVTAGGLWLAPRIPGVNYSRRVRGCVVLDLGVDCLLRESLEGYRAALEGEVDFISVDQSGWEDHARMAIVPGAGVLDSETVSRLMAVLGAGGTILLESGGEFLSEAEFKRQRDMLREAFSVAVTSTVDIWGDITRAIPYVNYTWPIQLMVRDFSRLTPVLAAESDVIGRLGAIPLACRKGVWNGEVIFLGSPVGTAAWAGDVEASKWIRTCSSLADR